VTVAVGQADGNASVTVEDNGQGIPSGEREQVFEHFYRIMGTESEVSGMGLAIVREVVECAEGPVLLGDAEGGDLI
ncbi:ATP-binding protein, partial [Rhizobium ruizarguesonis]